MAKKIDQAKRLAELQNEDPEWGPIKSRFLQEHFKNKKASPEVSKLKSAVAQDKSGKLARDLLNLKHRLSIYHSILATSPMRGYVPNQSQEKFHRSKKRGRGFFVGNRGGKTTSLVMESFAHAVGFRPWASKKEPDYHKINIQVPNIGRLYVSDYKAWERDVAQEWEKWVPPQAYKYTRNSQGAVTKITMYNRSVIYIMTSEMDSKASEGGKVQWVAYNEPPAQSHFKAAQRGLIDTNGPWWMCLTLIDDEPWIFDQIWAKADDNDTVEVITGSSEDNLEERGGVLQREALNEFAKFLTPEERAARIFGQPVFATGRIFRQYNGRPPFLIEPVPLQAHWPRFMATDPHARKPWATLWGVVDVQSETLYIVAELKDDSIKTLEAHRDRCHELEFDTFFPHIGQYGGTIPGILSTPAFRWIDPAAVQPDPVHGLTWQAELGKLGMYYDTWTRANKDIRITTAREWLSIRDRSMRPKVQVFSNCKAFDWELRHWYWDPKTGKPIKEGDDLVDCFLAFASANVIELAKGMTRPVVRPTEDSSSYKVRGQGPTASYPSNGKSSTGY